MITKGSTVHVHTGYRICTAAIALGDGHAMGAERCPTKVLLMLPIVGDMTRVEARYDADPESFRPEEGDMTYHLKEACPFGE